MTPPRTDPRGWRRAATLGLLLLAGALGGCGLLTRKPDPAAAQRPPAESLQPIYRLEVQAPAPLRRLLETYLDLGRFQQAPESERITATELERLVAAAPLQARGLLDTEGYVNARVTATREAGGAGGLPLVRVVVEPGPRTVVAEVDVQARGPLKQAADGGDAAALRSLQALRSRWPMGVGQPFRQADWSSAKNATLIGLQGDGYPAASWAETTARIEAATDRASLYALVDSGPLFHVGELRVEGLQRYRPEAVRNLATFGTGSRYSEKALLDTQERLARSGLFEGAVVEIDPDPAHADAAPVTLRVRELPRHQATFGLGYSDATGQRVSVEHTNRRAFSLLGSDWVSRTKVEFGRDLQSLEADLLSHPLEGGWRNLLGGRAQREDTAGTVVRSARLRAGRSVERERMDRLVFAELEQASTQTGSIRDLSRALSGNLHLVRRDLDSVLLPTRGNSLSLESGAGFAWSNTAANGAFARLKGRLTVYRPVGDRWYASARVEAGQVFARDGVGIPDTLLFRAGGDDSVRGYAYRSLGPQANGLTVSGRVLLTASAEIARPISASLPDFLWAVFADAGQAADRWQDLSPELGYGAGLRWRSPVGPLRIDLAYAEALRRFRMHLSVGVTF
ncbi:autotransporter assembly complex protein TamA [Piscinibacter sakaiensis]|uniref:POTRA domain-containing protein n=1 Tax=Piscinibacter sakaiensis TaxID=1547922 RepID=A0A0K8P7L1_PISS1|nr:BamA/TamA family outer membrane protein [Piscinibacter sakaiensis]GAP38519.1 hypothetical protein ISF6_4977 [Piscinibacter sakaiensis]